MYCPNCGAANDDASRFCVGCGTALAVPPSNVSGTYSQYGPTRQMPSRNERRDILIIVAAVLVVAMLMFAGLVVLLGNGLSGSASGNPSNNNAINNAGNDAVSINKINMAIDYEGTSSGYFGPSIQSQASDLNTFTGDEFIDPISLTNTDLSTSQNVTGIAVQSPSHWTRSIIHTVLDPSRKFGDVLANDYRTIHKRGLPNVDNCNDRTSEQ